MTDDCIESLASQIAFWRRADMSTEAFKRRVVRALRSRGRNTGISDDDETVAAAGPIRRHLSHDEIVDRNREIFRRLSSPERRRGDVERLAREYGLDRRSIHKIVADAVEAATAG